MPIQCLIRANNNLSSKGILKGMVEVIKDEPCEWGAMEGLPDYVIVRIPDATKAQAETFLQTWKNTLSYNVQEVIGAQTPTNQITLYMDTKIIEVLGDGMAIKQELRDLIVQEWEGDILSHNSNSVVFNISSDTDLELMKEQFIDQFEEVVAYRVYVFREIDVDMAISNGGYIEITRAQALNRIIDRRE